MTKYWIVVNNDHQGPFSKEELAAMGLSADTYAWHPGLPKWTQARHIEELADIVVEEETETLPETSQPQAPLAVEPEPPLSQPEPAPRQAAVPPPPPPQPVGATHNDTPAHHAKCPPSYLAWAIVTTILFCVPIGIAAIIYSSKVSGAWFAGNADKAHRYSERAAWLSNIAFVAGLIFFPFSMAISSIF